MQGKVDRNGGCRRVHCVERKEEWKNKRGKRMQRRDKGRKGENVKNV
jgi:hypothetical protein